MPVVGLKPYWETSDKSLVRLYCGDVRNVLRRLPTASVHCVVTSPPYWGLRDYDTGDWTGGRATCDHTETRMIGQTSLCKKCGAKLVDSQIGNEQSPELYLSEMVGIFSEIKRILRDDGVVWLNIGDSYAGPKGNIFGGKSSEIYQESSANFVEKFGKTIGGSVTANASLPSGNLVGIPWRLALALQADGWILRQDIIWHKPAVMPESVQNRCTKSHEYVFLLAKSLDYYYDVEAIKETSTIGELRHKRSVWTVANHGYPGAHFAVFPPALIEPMILAGTSMKGCCADCGSPWVRVISSEKLTRERPNVLTKRTGQAGTGNHCANTVAGTRTRTMRWEPTCNCHGRVKRKLYIDSIGESSIQSEYLGKIPLEEHPVIPCTVLDPFIGSGTTCCVSLANGRRSIGIDLSEKYLRDSAIPRIQGELSQRPEFASQIPKSVKRLETGKSLL